MLLGKQHLKVTSLLIISILAVTPLLLSQATTGKITGTVVDDSEAVIPGATVTVTNVDTGEEREAITDDSGVFGLPYLRPGVYDLRAEMPGFKTALLTQIEIRVDSHVRRQVTLAVGEVTEQVTVQAAATRVETETPAIGEVLQEREIKELPINQRSFVGLTRLTAGAHGSPFTESGNAGESHGFRIGRGVTTVTISGQRETSTNYMFDGIPSKEPFYGSSAQLPALDALAEVKVQRGFFSGENDNPAVVNAITKSGTNAIHGSGWLFHRNDNLDARNFFSVGNPEFLQNQFGAEVGGPVIQDKLFWFFSYEGFRSRKAATGRNIVPTSQHLQGDFSDLAEPLIDPLTGEPFPGNIIPSNRFHPFATQYIGLGFIPAPNQPPGDVFNLIGETGLVRNDDKFITRVDFALSETDRFFGRWSGIDSIVNDRSLLPGSETARPLTAHNLVFDWVHSFGPTLVANAKAGLNKVEISYWSPTNALTDPDWPTEFGIRNINIVPECNAVPGVSMGGFSTFGGPGSCIAPFQNDWHYIFNMSWIKGRHNLSWGLEVRDKGHTLIGTFNQQGSFQYLGQFTGHPVGDFLLGHTNRVIGHKTGPQVDKEGIWFNSFIQNEFKVSPNVSLTLGLRYQLYPWLVSTTGDRLGLFDGAANGGAGGFRAERDVGRVIDVDKNNFAPRIGIAWSPGGSQDFAIRSSFGIFYDEVPGNELAWDAILSPNNSIVQTFFSDTDKPTIEISTLFPDPPPGDPFDIKDISLILLSTPQRRSDPYQQIWTLSVQRMLPWGLFGEMAYVGSHGVSMSKRWNINRSIARWREGGRTANDPSCDSACRQANRAWPDFQFILTDHAMGQSWYHGLEFTLRKALSQGLSFLTTYSWAKSLDTDSFDSKGARNYVPWDRDKGLSTFDLRHRFNFSFVYELPLFEGQSTAMRHVLGGWQLSGITTLMSGFNFHPTTSSDPANSEAIFNKRPNRLGDGNLPAGQRSPDRWFDLDAFSLPAPGTFGNAGAQYLYSDGFVGQDFGLFKNFSFPGISEEAKVQFRTEFFNVFNNVNFGRPSANLESGSYGRITTATDARRIQFGLKVIF